MGIANRGSDDEEDEAAELMRELEKIKKERQQQKEKEVCRWILERDRCSCFTGTRTRRRGRGTAGGGHCARQSSVELPGLQPEAEMG